MTWLTIVTVIIIWRGSVGHQSDSTCVLAVTLSSDVLGLLLKGCVVCGRSCDGDGDPFCSLP